MKIKKGNNSQFFGEITIRASPLLCIISSMNIPKIYQIMTVGATAFDLIPARNKLVCKQSFTLQATNKAIEKRYDGCVVAIGERNIFVFPNQFSSLQPTTPLVSR